MVDPAMPISITRMAVIGRMAVVTARTSYACPERPYVSADRAPRKLHIRGRCHLERDRHYCSLGGGGREDPGAGNDGHDLPLDLA